MTRRPCAFVVKKQERVLIIDNDPEASSALKDRLNALGHVTYCADSSMEGYKLAHELIPEIIFVRLDMAVLDGYSLANLLRTEHRFANTVLVAIADSPSMGDIRRIELAGFDRHISKSVEDSELQSICNLKRRPPENPAAR